MVTVKEVVNGNKRKDAERGGRMGNVRRGEKTESL